MSPSINAAPQSKIIYTTGFIREISVVCWNSFLLLTKCASLWATCFILQLCTYCTLMIRDSYNNYLPHALDVHILMWAIVMFSISEPLTVNESEADAVGVESQEGDIQEILGGWTEVEMNAPRDFQHKVHTVKVSYALWKCTVNNIQGMIYQDCHCTVL